MDRVMVDEVRRFNRTVTQRIGALHDEYLAHQRSLGSSRLLWEIGLDGPGGAAVRDLRARLGLDSGYVSRQLRQLESAGLVTTDVGEADGRVRRVRLTTAGQSEREELDRASDELADSILGPLTTAQRDRLVAAMSDVVRLVTASQVRIGIVDPRSAAARFCLRSYFEELGRRFEAGFDPKRSQSASDAEMTLPQGLLLLARVQGDPVGGAALTLHDGSDAADVKRMWVAPQARGLGLGRQLLEQIADEATARGVRTLRLETNSNLVEARALYESAGFVEVEPFNDEPYAQHWFARRLDPPEKPRRARHR